MHRVRQVRKQESGHVVVIVEVSFTETIIPDWRHKANGRKQLYSRRLWLMSCRNVNIWERMNAPVMQHNLSLEYCGGF